jgi:hypothetical protein
MAAGKLRAVAGAAESETKSSSNPLFARFERGEIGVDEYLNARVSEAIAPFEGKLPADRITWLRGMLREKLETDPVLSERVRQATGRAPQAR